MRELANLWSLVSYAHFGDRMRPPAIALHEGTDRLAFWKGTQRTLSFSRGLVLEHPWSVVREVMKHEVVHQFVEEVMGIRDEPPHGPSFTKVCNQLGFDAAATGLPKKEEDPHDSSVLRRIAKLLALADSPNQHEAELAMKQAQRLMLKHNIDTVAAAAREGFSFRSVGEAKKRTDGHEKILAGILGGHFFVKVVWIPWYEPLSGKSGTVLEMNGTASNLDVAAYVYDFLLRTGERLWREHKKASGIISDRERRRFLLGMMMGFSEKLRAGVAESRQEGLVWSGDPRLETYLASRYPRLQSGRGVSFQRTEAFESGREAGRHIVLQRPVSESQDRGRFLPAKS